MEINFGNVAESYLKYRDDIPEHLIISLEQRGIEISGSKIADLGAGPGLLSKMLSDRGGIIDAVEPSEALIETGRDHVGDDPRINFKQGYAEDTNLQTDHYDIVIVLRAWHWFRRDKALKEIERIIKPEGYLIVMDSGFTPSEKVVKKSMKIIRKHSPDEELRPAGSKADSEQMINSFPVEWFEEWKKKKFDMTEMFKIDYSMKFSNEQWIGRLKTVSLLAYMDAAEQSKALDKVMAYLDENFEKKKLKIPHRLTAVILQNKNKR